MKVAFLITAYNNPAHLSRLVKALTHPDFYFFIHIDLKSDITPFTHLDFGQNCIFLDKERINVYHGGFTQVESVTNLMRVAAKANDFDYFFFLSGSDYPLKPAKFIHDFLESRYPMNFIDFYPLVGHANSVEYIHKYYFDDLTGKFPKPLDKYARIGLYRVCRRLPDRHFPKGVIPFRGSPWFCLNSNTVGYVLDYLHTKDALKLVNFFRRSWGAAETFFHTIILNSPHAKQCRYYDADLYSPQSIATNHALRNPNKGYLHYIDWSRDREDPAILNMSDFEALKNCDYLFGRKFFEVQSAELLDKIDRHLLQIEHKQAVISSGG